MSEVLAFHGVTCARDGRVLFERLSFTLAAGDAALISGPNGAGKSSLIRVAAGLLHPTAGHVTGPPMRALMAEASALDATQSLGQALLFWASLDAEPSSARERVLHALDAVGLATKIAVPMRLLSTGQRRRAAFARVVASRAPLWLLDEPANGLDVASVATLERLIAEHRIAGGVVLVATHLPIALPHALVVVLG